MCKIEVYLKSGQTLQIECESAEFERNTEHDEFSMYKLTGMVKPMKLSLCLSQIAGWAQTK